MKRSLRQTIAELLLPCLLVAACSTATQTTSNGGVSATTTVQSGVPQRSPAAAPSRRAPNNPADVHFMNGMIAHHAQAVLMAGWAPSHGARSDIRILCERIVVGQRDEIELMQNWLRDNGEKVPEPNPKGMRMSMGGMEHDMLMPGMLSEEEMAQLDKARGAEWDRLFLLGMIKHHQGAITMVDELFGSHGAAQDEVVFRFASDVYADQTTEIERMQKMLAALPSGGRSP